ncbi:MAG TPA: RNA polymerase sigma factor [Candidatus Limnocylindrales bacterium]|nr:RNA polymerase sigma factor [Candidatus Limnocylindrales bacterium]
MSAGERLAAATAVGLAAAADVRPAEEFEAAVRPHYADLVRRLVLVLHSRDDAEDVAQEAYLRAFRTWEQFDGRDVRAWLYTIGLRLAFNELRRHRRRLAAMGRLRPVPWTGPADPDLSAALGRLDGRTRAALLLTAVDGYSVREVATILGSPEGTVASWLSRGRARLRAELDRPR